MFIYNTMFTSISQGRQSLLNQEQKNYLKQLIEIKPLESYPESIKRELKIISLNPKESPSLFGSALYRMQMYGSDIDAIQHIHYTSELSTIQTFIRTLKKIIKNLDRNHVYSEFKAGLDFNYIFSIGTLQNGIFTPDTNLLNTIKIKHQFGLFSDYEYITMTNALKMIEGNQDTNIHSMAYDYVYDLIRSKYILRWSKKEILQGFKIITYGQRYTLAQALNDETIVKIDLISLVNGKFVEVTNILFLAYPQVNQNGEIEYIPVNISETKLHAAGLSPDIEKLYYSNKFYSPFKACKRIYSEMRKIKNFEYLPKLAPIIRYEISLLYQIKGQIETFLIILEKTKAQYYVKLINDQLQEIKGRLNYVLDIPRDDIIKYSKEIDYICFTQNIVKKHELINILEKALKSIIEYLTIKDMNKYGFNPIPNIFLPSPKKYDPNLIRSPTDNPTQIYKEFVKLLNG
jgi:hypothetical protein